MSAKIKTRRVTPPTRLLACITIAFALGAICFTSCNVTRKVITQSEYLQRGDTSIVIVTKTTETYDASKKMPLAY